jgi:2-polyprenyl-3-methyl-5-hydroxy-6-metoxy-1,4-benzoquinol methylase
MALKHIKSDSGNFDHSRELRRLIAAYDSPLIRSYSMVRFRIININILHILALCLRDRRTVLDIGCGFGLFGCYFAMRYPHLHYLGCDIDPARIDAANRAAAALELKNIKFLCQDARSLQLGEEFDAILTIDLLHHLDNAAKSVVLHTCERNLSPGGRLIIKEIAPSRSYKMAFTWLLDVLMTRGFDMWYWSENDFRNALDGNEWDMEKFPVSDWMPYPHIIYVFDRRGNMGEDVSSVRESVMRAR